MSIRNRHTLLKGSPATSNARQISLDLLDVALDAVNPHYLVKNNITVNNKIIRVGKHAISVKELDGICVIGAGKATGRMAEAIESLLFNHLTSGAIIVSTNTEKDFSLKKIKIFEGGHPLPNQGSLQGTQYITNLVLTQSSNTLILCLLSGGGSALLTLPPPPITLKDIQETTTLLLRSGAPIQKVNIVRKHLSQIKGGRLSKLCLPRPLWSLIISDVPGDHLETVASGPTLPDTSTFMDAFETLNAFDLWSALPSRVQQFINQGITREIPESPKPGESLFKHTKTHLIGSNRTACEAILNAAKTQNFSSRILTTDCQGEARDVGRKLGKLAQKLCQGPRTQTQIIILGSETTVTIKHPGKGGRNSELVAAAMPFLQELDGVALASLTTDGIDGPTEFAGVIADGNSFSRAQSQSPITPQEALATNSTYTLFQALEDHIQTGPTHTNVRDISIIVVLPKKII
jgi:glycerate-2-kinase